MEKISKHFSFAEFVHSDTAKKKGIKNIPKPEHIINAKILAKNILEKIRIQTGEPIKINSWFRSRKLNKAVGGSFNSQHRRGYAVDIAPTKKHNVLKIAKIIIDYLEYDQLIIENITFNKNKEILHNRRSWVHVSFIEGKNRNKILAWEKRKGYTRIFKKRIVKRFPASSLV